MVMDKTQGKVTPEVFQSIMLDEIAGRLAKIQEHLEKQVASGYVVSTSVSVTDEPIEVNLGVWVKATLFNDGDDGVYVYNTRQMPNTRDAALKKGDSLPIDKGERTTDRFYLVCKSGETATVRIFYI